jgi:dinuclear metal center YbgI/SA1388 family protein
MGPDLIAKAEVADHVANNIQIKGKPQVEKIALGVSCSQKFLEKSLEWGAEYVICHHGLSTEGYIHKGRFDAIEDRLKILIKNDISLAGFHHCLDVHPEIGNNAQLIKKLAAHRLDETYFESWGWIGEFSTAVLIEDLISRLEKITSHSVYTAKFGPKKIKRIGVCSGGARPRGNTIFEIIDKKLDAIVTGEITESGPHIAESVGYNYLSAGHYATETFGVKALAKKLIEIFGINVQVKFIDVPSQL